MDLLATASASVSSIIVPLAIVLVLTGVLLAVLSVVRRKMRGELMSGPRDFTLTELRDLHRQGKLTDEEFERAKALLVGKVHSNLAKEAKPSLAEKPLHTEVKMDDRNAP